MPPDHIGVMIAAFIMMVIGWGGLYILIDSVMPRVGPRWLFFMLLLIATTGTILPLVRYLNARFTKSEHDLPPGGVLVRQSVWVGIFVVTCAWLQIPRVLTPPIAFFLGLVFVVIEVFLRFRELGNEIDDED